MSFIFTFNQESALKAGSSDFIGTSGAYVGKLSGKWVSGSNGSQSAALELSIDGAEGKARYLSIWYKKTDGTDSAGGVAMINAIIGLLKLQGLSAVQRGSEYFCPEIEGREIGLVLQKVLQTKQNGDETYKFDVRMPFNPQTRKTLKELMENKPAETISKILETLKDRDDRKTHAQQSGQGNDFANAQNTPPAFNDDLPDWMRD